MSRKQVVLKNIKQSVRILFIALLCFGCANVFSEMADKKTDRALLYEARKKLGAGDYDGALEVIAEMTTEEQEKRTVKTLKASAYSGKCGLDFLALADAIQAGGSSFFNILLSAFRAGTNAELVHCITAEDILKTIGTAEQRNTEENLLMAFNSLAKIGVILAIRADTDNDGDVDAGFTPCHTVQATGLADLPRNDSPTSRADTYELTTGMGLFITSMIAAGAEEAGGDFLETIDSVCDALPDPTICQIVNRADVSDAEQMVLRAMVHDNSGIGLAISDASAAPATCDVATCLAAPELKCAY